MIFISDEAGRRNAWEIKKAAAPYLADLMGDSEQGSCVVTLSTSERKVAAQPCPPNPEEAQKPASPE